MVNEKSLPWPAEPDTVCLQSLVHKKWLPTEVAE